MIPSGVSTTLELKSTCLICKTGRLYTEYMVQKGGGTSNMEFRRAGEGNARRNTRYKVANMKVGDEKQKIQEGAA